MEQTMQIQQIPLSALHPHPQNANVMPAAAMKKLARHIEATGRYEPLVVRPHPTIAGGYELINGHHRKRVLESLGCEHANCVVWNLTDSETLLLLATINRLSGSDAPGKRLQLIDALAEALKSNSQTLALYLPEDQDTLGKLLREAAPVPMEVPPEVGDMPEAFTVFMAAAEKRRLVAALKKTAPEPAAALLQWAEEHGG